MYHQLAATAEHRPKHRAAPRFEDASDRSGPVMALSEVSGGAAFGDIDNDGDTDLVDGLAPMRRRLAGYRRRASTDFGAERVDQGKSTAPPDAR